MKARIERYIEEVTVHLDRLPASRRYDELMRLRPKIERDLGALGWNRADVEALLRRLAPPSKPAHATFARRGPQLSTEDAHWLGVCSGLAEYLGLHAPWVQGVFFLAGMLTGPFAIMGYLILYGVMRRHSNPDDVAPIDLTNVVLKVGKVLLLAVTIFVMAKVFVVSLGYLVAYFGSHTGGNLDLGWFVRSHGRIFVWLLVTVLPVAVLGALPLANEWDKTLTKVSYALVAVYSLVVCFGLASMLVNALLILLQLAPSLDGFVTLQE